MMSKQGDFSTVPEFILMKVYDDLKLKTLDCPILQTWSGEERIFILMAHLSCAYLNTNKGIGTIPNETSEDRNSRKE
jgi:hypothetical protein